MVIILILYSANHGKNTFHYDHIVCNDKNFDFCLEMKFHCDENEVTKFVNLKEESTKCSFKGENIFASSKNCLDGIDKENWDLEVLRYIIYKNKNYYLCFF